MAREEDHGRTPAELADRVWHLAESIRTALLATQNGARPHVRPLSAIPKRAEDAIYFLVDVSGSKNAEIERNPEVTLAFADTGKGDYVTIAGTASVSNDRARIRELWTPFAKAWWSSEDDPDIRLLTVTPEKAEIWEGPNKLVAAAIMLTAAVTGAAPAVGEHGKVRL
ncbi:MAG: pyridoxamine 5'-phosphate oxidase family protein [Bauldia sp.]|nr:pyridoxamine 5'-phosphate oxidase family protein [Bauldia sp.]